jgi:GT2 family glycosyltransferase
MKLTVIIPLARHEDVRQALWGDLRQLSKDGTEILIVSSDFPEDFLEIVDLPGFEVRQITAAPGRAAYLNAGAEAARGKYLWFLHADSRFHPHTLSALKDSIQRYPDALLFFDLAFLNDAFPLIKLNEWGGRLRSRLGKIPFGDQGFCIRRDLFEKVGGYPLDVSYGEDHLFVWRARRSGIPLRCTGAKLYTSARKYREKGWFKITVSNQYLWIKQAYQEWRRHRASCSL